MLTPKQIAELRAGAKNPNRLRQARLAAKLTQVELAAIVRMTQTHISNLENGEYADMPLETSRVFAKVFGCAIEDLFPKRSGRAEKERVAS